MDVVDRDVEPPPAQKGEHRIAPDPVQHPHRVGHHRAAARRQPAALDQVVAGPEAIHEAGDLAEVVAGVGVAHQNEAAPSGVEPADQGRAVPPLRDVDDPRSGLRRDLG
jgi:hypothetical protein